VYLSETIFSLYLNQKAENLETFLNYFETIPSSHRSLILVGGLAFFWLLEGAVPLFKFNYKKWEHAIPNIFFTITTIIINFVLAFLLLQSADWVMANHFGILNWLPEIPLWLYIILGVFLMDSSDIKYMYEDEDGGFWMDMNATYYGELDYFLSYKNEEEDPMKWLYLDFEKLQIACETVGLKCELVIEGEHFDYLARLIPA